MSADELRLLLIEDDPELARLVVRQLGASLKVDNLVVNEVRDLASALEQLSKTGYDVVLTDLSLPDATGVTTLHAVLEARGEAAVIVLTGSGDRDIPTTALRKGAQDFLSKDDVSVSTLQRAIEHALERHRIQQELEKANRRLLHAVGQDQLTGLFNRSGLVQRAEEEIDNARAEGRQGGLLYIDLDGFKEINDRHGHLAGDHVLKAAAQRLRGALRPLDLAARWGGDEFVVLLVELAEQRDCRVVARRIVAELRKATIFEGQELSVAASVGGTTFPQGDSAMDALLAIADAAMYEAKRRGGNRVVVTRDGHMESA